jgi:BirA family biotin operon repressor/biotin-[acetyl-CoA-carboxylase] ligase
MGSTLVRLGSGDPPAPSLSFVSALAVFETIAPLFDASHHLQLKWPNDVLFDRSKVAGILLEMVGDAVVVGIGVNLASAPDLPDRPTASLSGNGQPPDRDLFAISLAEHFATELCRWREFGLSSTLPRFLYHSMHQIGTRTVVHDADGEPIVGGFAGLEQSDGALCLRLDDGSERVVRAGDVMLESD